MEPPRQGRRVKGEVRKEWISPFALHTSLLVLTKYFFHNSDQLFRFKRLDNPAGGTGSLAF